MTELQKYQLKFIKNSFQCYEFHILVSSLDQKYNSKKINKNEYHRILKEWMYLNIKQNSVLYITAEVILCDIFVEVVQSILWNFPFECYVAAGTSNKYKYFLDPIVQIKHWDLHCYIQRNGEDRLFNQKYFENIKKNIKGILTLNRPTAARDYLDSKIKNFTGYYNYVHKSNNFLDWKTHSDLSKRSYVHFVVETQSNVSDENNFTEKTYLPILEESIIVVLGGRRFVKSLSELGIKTWNEEFGFNNADDTDEYITQHYYDFSKKSNFYKKIIDSYVNCINYFDSLSIEDIKKLYEKNKNVILNNKKIITDVIYS